MEYVIGILGIIVSVLSFLIGYRRTVGAKKERVNTGNSDVERILIRRIVLESYEPTAQDISRLLEGKARDLRVRVGDLYSEAQVVNSIFTRILETDFIAREQREKILSSLTPTLVESESRPIDDQEVLQTSIDQRRSRARSRGLLASMGMAAAIVGTLVASVTTIGAVETDLKSTLELVSVTMAASLSAIFALITAFRVRESQQETSNIGKTEALASEIKFEDEVAKAISEAGLKAELPDSGDRSYDFLVEANEHRILVEVKSLNRPQSSRILAFFARRLEQAVKDNQATEGILVTKKIPEVPSAALGVENIQFATLRELKKYLGQLA